MRAGLPLSEGAESFEAAELQLSLVMCGPSAPAHRRTGALARDPFQTRGLAVMREGTAGGAEGGRPVTEIGGRSLQELLQEPSGAGTSGVPPELIVGELVTDAARSGGAAPQWARG
ncbi:hypothetical protein [Streptomyces sp. C1-2]|uniref:hypothetical protein n=1 Tax=Streptomyces sp. C1-2 TaxID=2720022 RepID=UPI001432438D|nr:hypothetical protein [Streptomyces sp. C1-2]NJP74660.1 hypothetical protein [Streptomyces sp. C1-2]